MSLLSRTMDRLRGRRRPHYDADGWPVGDNASFRRTVHAVDPASGTSVTAQEVGRPGGVTVRMRPGRAQHPELDYVTGCGQGPVQPDRAADGLVRDAVFGWRREP